MDIVQIWTMVEHGGLAGVFAVFWWLERAERKDISKRVKSIEGKLEKCLRDRLIELGEN